MYDTKQITEKFEQFGKAAVASAKELEGINSKVFNQLFDQQRAFIEECVEMGNKTLSLTTQTKTLDEAFRSQLAAVTEYNEKLIAAVKAATEVFAGSQAEYQAWFEKGVKVVSEVAPFPSVSEVVEQFKPIRKAA